MLWLLVAAHASPLVLPEGPAQLVDVDGDGAIDLLLGAGESAQFGDGAGGFGPVVPLLRALEADDAVLADLDGDGLPDLCRFTWQQTTCLQGQGRSFGAPLLDLPERSDTLWAVDVDGDSDLDLLRVDLDGLHQHLNDGSGAFAAPVLLLDLYVDRLFEADVDGDGDLDVVGHHLARVDPVWWLERRADGHLAAPALLLPDAVSATTLAFTDVDRDGSVDMLHQSYVHPVYVRHRTEEGVVRDDDTADTATFVPGESLYGPLVAMPYGGPFAVADLLGTGSPGLLIGDDGALLWDATLDGTPEVLWGATDDVDHRAVPRVAHLDTDGTLDVVTFDRDVRVTLDPLGAAQEALLQRGASPSGYGASGFGPIATGDLDADGLPDVVYALDGESVAVVLFGTGGGGYGPPTVVGLPGLPRGLALVDLDRDGALDILLVTKTGTIAWSAGDGTGGLAPAQVLPESAGQGLAVLDIDHDGADEVVLGAGADGLRVLDDDGVGAVVATAVPTSAPVDQLAMGDTDGDGWSDLVALARAGRSNAELLLFHGGPAGLSETATLPAPGRAPTELVVGDLDADGLASIWVLGQCELGYAYGSPNYPYCLGRPSLQRVDEVAQTLILTTADALRLDPPLAMADIDDDGVDELLGGGSDGCYGLCAYDDALDPTTAEALSLVFPLTALHPGELDGDGTHDVLVATDDALHIAWNRTAPPPTPGPTGDTGTAAAPTGDTGMAEPTRPTTDSDPTPAPGTDTTSSSTTPGDDTHGSKACACQSGSSAPFVLLPLLGLVLRRRGLSRPHPTAPSAARAATGPG